MALMIERILEHRLPTVLKKKTRSVEVIQEAFEYGVIDKDYIRKEQLIQAVKKYRVSKLNEQDTERDKGLNKAIISLLHE